MAHDIPGSDTAPQPNPASKMQQHREATPSTSTPSPTLASITPQPSATLAYLDLPHPGICILRSSIDACRANITSTVQPITPKEDGSKVAVYGGTFYDNRGDAHDAVVKAFLAAEGITVKVPRATNEVKALDQLTRRDCGHALELLAFFVLQREGFGLEHYVVMSKVPGYDVGKNEWSDREIGNIRAAFRVAIQDVHRCGIDNGSHHPRNLMYDEVNDKCYIVDYERASFSMKQKTALMADDADVWTKDPDDWYLRSAPDE